MNELILKQLQFLQLSTQTSINCWWSFNLRCSLLANQPLLDSRVMQESNRMVNEKFQLSAEILERLTSMNSISELNDIQREILILINDRAAQNVDRLTDKS